MYFCLCQNNSSLAYFGILLYLISTRGIRPLGRFLCVHTPIHKPMKCLTLNQSKLKSIHTLKQNSSLLFLSLLLQLV